MSSINDRLMLKVETDLSKISFYLLSRDKEELLGFIDKPLLLWDPEMIKELNKSYLIKALFGKETLIEYDKTSIVWNEGVWPPSIDSLFFAKVVKEAGYTRKPITSIYDVGCGTGFLGIFLAKQNRFIKTVYAIDVEEKAIDLTIRNAEANGIADRLVSMRGNFTKKSFFPIVDLIVSAPPYIPTISDTMAHPFYAGTQQLEFLMTDGGNICKEMIVVYSHLAEQAIKNKRICSVTEGKVLASMEVPFRVKTVLEDREWLNFLVNQCGLIEKEPHVSLGYRYWHVIKVVRFIN